MKTNRIKASYEDIVKEMMQDQISRIEKSKQILKSQIEEVTKGKNIVLEIKESNIRF